MSAREAVIRKQPADFRVAPNLRDPEAGRAAFSWEAARAELAGLPGGGLNIAHEAVDRHAAGPRANRVALRWLAAAGGGRDISYAELARDSNRFANLLRGLGVARGDAVFVLCGRIPMLYAAVLGALKCGAVVSPLFSAFGPEPLKTRINLGRGKVLVTTESLYERRVRKVAGGMPTLKHVLQVDSADFRKTFDSSSGEFEIENTAAEDASFLHFTSGTTGAPKGAMHVHGAVVAHYASGKYALDLHPEDVFWCTADPGWVTGTSYGIVAPAILEAQAKSLEELMRDLADLVKRARAGSLRASELSSPTITFTSLGDEGVEAVQGVIYPPQVALVGFGKSAERPWAEDGKLAVLRAVTATLAADHRVTNGHRGALFLAEINRLLRAPESL